MNDPLVSTDWLAAHLGDPKVVVVDATWFMPAAQRNPRAEFEAAHLPGAVFFDIDAVADATSGLPHMLPTAEAFAAAVSAMGIGDDTTIIAYDGNGLVASARLWWTFRAMGHDAIEVLDGGLAKWRTEGRPLESGPAFPRATANFTPKLRPELVRNFEQVKASTSEVLDARPGPRFRGEVAEPRAGLKSGHMPGARSLPSSDLVDADGRLKSADDLYPLFREAGVDLSAPIITSCGSGVTACVLALGLARLGIADAPVYDGSWTEWGGRDDAPVETSR
ncbi:MAG: 3-mercaptopyruvate sulfurtransferase [Caulobacteraceae bacterium]